MLLSIPNYIALKKDIDNYDKYILDYYKKNNNLKIENDFYWFCNRGNLKRVIFLWNIKPNMLITKQILLHSCINENLDVFKWLLITSKASEKLKLELFRYSLNSNEFKISKFLLTSFKSINTQKNVFHDIVKKKNHELIKWFLLLFYNDNHEYINENIDFIILHNNTLKTIKYIIKKYKIQITNKLFEISCVNGNYKLSLYLLKLKPDIINFDNFENMLNNIINSFLEYSVINKIVKFLLNVNKNQINNYNLLVNNCCIKSNLKLMIYLTKNKKKHILYNDVNFKTACSYGSYEISEWFVKKYPLKYKIYKDFNYHYNVKYKIIKQLNIEKKISSCLMNKNIEECNICQNIKSDIYTDCFHFYCKMCIFEWMDVNSNCPICRKELTENNLLNIE
jgi:hypothetical protein